METIRTKVPNESLSCRFLLYEKQRTEDEEAIYWSCVGGGWRHQDSWETVHCFMSLYLHTVSYIVSAVRPRTTLIIPGHLVQLTFEKQPPRAGCPLPVHMVYWPKPRNIFTYNQPWAVCLCIHCPRNKHIIHSFTGRQCKCKTRFLSWKANKSKGHSFNTWTYHVITHREELQRGKGQERPPTTGVIRAGI